MSNGLMLIAFMEAFGDFKYTRSFFDWIVPSKGKSWSIAALVLQRELPAASRYSTFSRIPFPDVLDADFPVTLIWLVE